MHSQICEFPSRTLYGSKLKSDPAVASHLLNDLPNTNVDSEEERQELLGTPIVFFDTAGCEYFERVDGEGDEGSRSNENEATLVKNWVDNLVPWHPFLSLYLYSCLTGLSRSLTKPNICHYAVS